MTILGGELITLDRIVAMEPGSKAEAHRNVPNSLVIFDSHFPRKPVLPGVLILGSMGRLAELLLEETTGSAWRLVGARRVRFRHFVQPGDTMALTVELKERSDDAAVCSGTATVEGRPVTTATELRLTPVAVGEGEAP